jgi:hypothetical protein
MAGIILERMAKLSCEKAKATQEETRGLAAKKSGSKATALQKAK